MRSHAPFIPAIAAALLLGGPGCSGPAPIIRSADPYAGPAISIDSTGDQHIIVATAPSGGWSFVLDQSRPVMGHKEVFATLTRPNPALMHSTALVPHNLASGVSKDLRIDVLVRIADYGAPAVDFPYHLAASSSR